VSRKQALSPLPVFGCYTEPEMSAQITPLCRMEPQSQGRAVPQFCLRSGSLHSEKIGCPLAGAAGRVSRSMMSYADDRLARMGWRCRSSNWQDAVLRCRRGRCGIAEPSKFEENRSDSEALTPQRRKGHGVQPLSEWNHLFMVIQDKARNKSLPGRFRQYSQSREIGA
jgi:hypothetical protein